MDSPLLPSSPRGPQSLPLIPLRKPSLAERVGSPLASPMGSASSVSSSACSSSNPNLTPSNASMQGIPPATFTPVGTPAEALSMGVDDYILGPPIGYGSSAAVHLATHVPSGRPVAIKTIDLDMFERNQIDELRREIQIMTLCKHPHLLTVYGSFVKGSKLWIVTPFLSAGSCLDIMKTAFPTGLDEVSVATILKQALQGLEYLHRNGLIHRDVKAGNLLMSDDGFVQLADFGVSATLMDGGERKGQRKTFVGTPCWMAPEVMEQSGYDYKADVWSFGITALELANGHAPFAKYPPIKVLMLTLQNEPPTLDRENTKHKYSKTFKDMIDACLSKDPVKRPTAEKLLQHPFFKQAKKKEYIYKMILQGLPPIQMRAHNRRLPENKLDTAAKGIKWDFDDDSDDARSPVSEKSREQDNARKRVSFLPIDEVILVDGGGDQVASPESTWAAEKSTVNLVMTDGDAAAESPTVSMTESNIQGNTSSVQSVASSASSSLAGTMERKKSRFIVDSVSAAASASASTAAAVASTSASSTSTAPSTQTVAASPVVATMALPTTPATTQSVDQQPVLPSSPRFVATNPAGGSEIKKGRFMLESTTVTSLERSSSLSIREASQSTIGGAPLERSVSMGQQHQRTSSENLSLSNMALHGIVMTPATIFDGPAQPLNQQLPPLPGPPSVTSTLGHIPSASVDSASGDRRSRFAIQTTGSQDSMISLGSAGPNSAGAVAGAGPLTGAISGAGAGASNNSASGTMERGRRGRFEVTSGEDAANSPTRHLSNLERIETMLRWNDAMKGLLTETYKNMIPVVATPVTVTSSVPPVPSTGSASASGPTNPSTLSTASSISSVASVTTITQASLTPASPSAIAAALTTTPVSMGTVGVGICPVPLPLPFLSSASSTSVIIKQQQQQQQEQHGRTSSGSSSFSDMILIESRVRDLAKENEILRKENEFLRRDNERLGGGAGTGTGTGTGQ